MAPTYYIDRKTVEGNRRVHYGHFMLASGDCSGGGTVAAVVRELTTGLRRVERLEVWEAAQAQLLSGIVLPRVTYPVYRSGDNTVWPAYDKAAMVTSSEKHFASGNFTIEFTSTAGPILWKAIGRV